jgi:teichuronic acid biosynthesis glycosyltransferase TuaC
MSDTQLHLLTFGTLYPSAARPNHGVFVENRLRHLAESGEASSTVLAPAPYYPRGPLAARIGHRFGWAQTAQTPRLEVRHGLAVHHPRFLAIPKIGMNIAPFLLAGAARPVVRRLLDDGVRIDLIDAHYLYPDGVAAVMLARHFGLPVTVTARGSDVTQLPDYPLPRRMIRWAIGRADALIAVSAALGRRMIELGADPAKVHVLRNGIDVRLFRPVARAPVCRELGLPDDVRLLISVGHLIERKRTHLAIAAIALLPEVHLAIVGDGPERAALEALTRRLDVAERVHFLGPRPHDALPSYYSAADAMVLASSREGWANVLLEAMACGTPVIASDIAGNAEVVQSREAGLIVRENTPEGIAEAACALFDNPPERAATRAYAERFSWDETTQGQLRLFRAILAHRAARRAEGSP